MFRGVPNYVAGCQNYTFSKWPPKLFTKSMVLKVNMSDIIEVVMVKMIIFFQCNTQHVSLHDNRAVSGIHKKLY